MLYEILVPTEVTRNGKTKRVRTRHHKEWDKYVRAISGGLTILTPAKGQWVFESKLFSERMIPVRISCTYDQIVKIANFTKLHYNQLKVMFYKVTEEVYII